MNGYDMIRNIQFAIRCYEDSHLVYVKYKDIEIFDYLRLYADGLIRGYQLHGQLFIDIPLFEIPSIAFESILDYYHRARYNDNDASEWLINQVSLYGIMEMIRFGQ